MNSAVDGLTKAQSLVQLKRWDEAIEALDPALGDQDLGANAYCLRSQCYLAKGDRGEAKSSAEGALTIEPDSEWAHRLMAIVLLRGRRRKAALKHAAEAARIQPNTAEPLSVLCRCQLALGKNEDARETAAASLRGAPHSALSHKTAGDVSKADEDLPAAERHYRDGLAINPHDSDLPLALAGVLKAQGKRDEAGETYLAAARQNPTDQRAHSGLERLGVPVLGFGVLFLIKVGLIGAGRVLIENPPKPVDLALGLAAGLLIVGFAMTVTRITGTQNLPEYVQDGIRAKHTNFALRWVQWGAGLALVFAIWCALISSEDGGGTARALVFVVTAGLLWLLAHRLWKGPTLSFESIVRSPARLINRVR